MDLSVVKGNEAHRAKADVASLAATPADLEEGLHQLAQEWIRAHMRGEIVSCLLVWVGDARREQAIGDGLRVHVGEAVGVQVVDECRLERLHESGQRPLVGLDGERSLDAVADVRAVSQWFR